ncbi:MAG: hypothetical protein HC789_16110 [Microcoleus sp. CSU_2_2]|nr:hypothetical protein [Microcoleus sp. CSU_2_2]
MIDIIKFSKSLLPFERLTIPTTLKLSEVLERLDEAVEPPKMFRMNLLFRRPNKPYEGTISGNTFKISRIIRGRNSFLPVIEGEIHPESFGCSIAIKMSLYKVVLIFTIYWLSITGSFWILALLAWLVDRSVGPIFLPILGMFIFGWLLCLIPFKIEAKMTTKFLFNLFREELVD